MAGGRIFISYRRADSQWAASRLYDTLTNAFPDERLFMDVDSIDPGQDFARVLEEQVGSCDVFLALIGPDWLEERGASGERRIDDPADFVRVEIGSALARTDTVTIPVLLDGAAVPDEAALPEPLRPLARRQFARLTHEGYRGEVERLVEGIRKALAQRKATAAAMPPPRPRRDLRRPLRRGAAVLTGLGVVAGAVWYASRPADPSGTPDLAAFKECAACPEMVALPAGAFTMGSPPDEPDRLDQEGPAHEVQVGRFALARTELSFADWDACVADGGCGGYTPPDEGAGGGAGRGELPVFNVSWEDAHSYLDWLNGKVPGEPYRLPSEAEWEYAMRAGTVTAYPWGEAPDRAHANTGREICCIGAAEGPDKWIGVAPVAQFPANAFGLHDMAGNLAEWAADISRDSYAGAPSDGSEWVTDSVSGWPERRVLRGGSFGDRPALSRSAARISNDPGWRGDSIGFRPARSLASR